MGAVGKAPRRESGEVLLVHQLAVEDVDPLQFRHDLVEFGLEGVENIRLGRKFLFLVAVGVEFDDAAPGAFGPVNVVFLDAVVEGDAVGEAVAGEGVCK